MDAVDDDAAAAVVAVAVVAVDDPPVSVDVSPLAPLPSDESDIECSVCCRAFRCCLFFSMSHLPLRISPRLRRMS